jgi:hypothetical protein
VGPYRVQFEVVAGGVRAVQVEIAVSAAGMGDATAKAAEIARRDYGDAAKSTGIVTYFHPRASSATADGPSTGDNVSAGSLSASDSNDSDVCAVPHSDPTPASVS